METDGVPEAVQFAASMSRLLEQVEAVIDTISGYRAKLFAAGFQPPYVEEMLVDFHRFMMGTMEASVRQSISTGTPQPATHALFDEQVYPTPAGTPVLPRRFVAVLDNGVQFDLDINETPPADAWLDIVKGIAETFGLCVVEVRERFTDDRYDVVWRFK